ncbi:MAG: AgmX/PglI C-terminal domain-containing protein [Deltaproteobacteria bacterium]|nr:AgmX/PglI C-terminal domain-containing protein [Deltaproteobacteria bacterium]
MKSPTSSPAPSSTSASDTPWCEPSLLGSASTNKSQVLHLEVTWGGTLLDLVTLPFGRRHEVHFPDGLRAQISTPKQNLLQDAAVVLCCETFTLDLPMDAQVELPSGHELHLHLVTEATPGIPIEPHPAGFLHTLMVVCAAQVCLVSAIAMAPGEAPDPHAGGGVPSERLRRYIRVSSSSAEQVSSQASVASSGRILEAAERLHSPKRRKGRRPGTPRKGPGNERLAEALDALQLAVSGLETGSLKDLLGDPTKAVARSQTRKAGLGGILAPKELLATGVGSGDLGVGKSRIQNPISEVLNDFKKHLEQEKKVRRLKKPIRVARLEVPNASVQAGLGADAESDVQTKLDPLIRDHLSRQVRRHRNAVRYCYETWGLTANPTKSGRLTLELTFHPDGALTEIDVLESDPNLHQVSSCVKKMAANWYLGDGLVKAPRRLSFPFILQPRQK